MVLRENGFLDAITLWPTHTDKRYLGVMMVIGGDDDGGGDDGG